MSGIQIATGGAPKAAGIAAQAITFRIPAGLYERLRKEAFETRESMNGIVTAALKQELDRREGGRQ